MQTLSVIICTYNPNKVIFNNCLKAINEASVLFSPLEIIIVDNNSIDAVSEQDYIKEFISERKSAKVIIEEKQGLTPARLKGIKEAKGDILIFIDDDNFIHADFFSKGIDIAAANPHIGSWSGQVKLVFEHEPEEWTRRYWGLLVYREFDNDRWSNFPHMSETMPCGAGLFVRKNVASRYYSLHEEGKRNIQLDRIGNSLFSGGDNDLAACACDIGLGVGLFHELALDHFIPDSRLRKEYLLKLAEGISTSAIVFKSFRNEFPQKRTLKNRLADSLRLLLKQKTDKDFYRAVLRGQKKGYAMVFNTKYTKSRF